MRWISEHLRHERMALLLEMRQACVENRLHFNKDAAIVDAVVTTIKRSHRNILKNGGEGVTMSELVSVAETTAMASVEDSENTGHVSRLVSDGSAAQVCRNIVMSLGSPRASPSLPECMDPKRQHYHDWHWPMLLMRALRLPLGLAELIMEYLPTPRMWKWSLVRLKKRITLAPHAATIDISIILDEMFTDMTLFQGSTQRVHLLNIARNEQVI